MGLVLIFSGSCAAAEPLLENDTIAGVVDIVIDPSPTPEATEEPAPEADTDPAASWEAYLSIENGVALRHPAGWVIQEEPFLALATEPDLLVSTAGQTTGALLSIVPAPQDIQLAEDLSEALSQFLEQQDAFQVLIPPQPLEWGGQDATFARGVGVDEEGLEFVVLFGLVRNRGATLFLSGVTPDHLRYERDLREIMESVIVSQAETSRALPVEEDDILTVLLNNNDVDEISSSETQVSAGPTTYQDVIGRFQLRLPGAWQVDDDDQDAILFASSLNLINTNELDSGAVIWAFPQTYPAEQIAVDDNVVAVELLSQFIANFGIYDGLEVILPPTQTTIGPYAAATAQYDATFQSFPILVDYYAVLNEGEAIFFVNLVAAESVNEQKPIADQLVESVRFN